MLCRGAHVHEIGGGCLDSASVTCWPVGVSAWLWALHVASRHAPTSLFSGLACWFAVCLSLSLCLSVSLSLCLSVSLSLSVALSLCLSVSLFLCRSVCLSPRKYMGGQIQTPALKSTVRKRRGGSMAHTSKDRLGTKFRRPPHTPLRHSPPQHPSAIPHPLPSLSVVLARTRR